MMHNKKLYLNNFDAELVNCSRKNFITYQSLNSDPQFIFTNLQAGAYIVRIRLASDEIIQTSAEIYWNNNRNEFSSDSSLAFTLYADEHTEFYLYLEKDGPIRIDPVSQNCEFEFDVSIIYCSQNFLKAKMITQISKHSDYESKSDNIEQIFAAYQQDSIQSGVQYDYDKFVKKVWQYLKASSADIESIQSKTLFSIIIPVYNTDPDYLRSCLNSVVMQSYENWELCIVDDASTNFDTKKVLHEFEKLIPSEKFNIHYRESNGHICEASNDAVKMASGDFLVLVDHDDLLHLDALYWIAKCIDKNHDVNLVYTDEDKLCQTTNRFISPHFKPAFNLNLLLSYNYICHLSAFRRSIVQKVNGFRSGYEGSQDYDLALRVIAQSNRNQVAHIPIPLYHWRVHQESTAARSSSKDYTTDAGLMALTDFLSGYKLNQKYLETPSVISTSPNRYRVLWPLKKGNEPTVELIIPTKDKANILRTAVESIFKNTDYRNYRITIVDNGSKDQDTLDLFTYLKKKYSNKLRILQYNKPFNYSAINNYAVSKSDSKLVGLVNNDIEVINADWLTELVSLAIQDDVGCVGAKLYYSDERIQHAGVIIGIGGVAGHSHKYLPRSECGYMDRLLYPQETSAVTAACLIIKRSIYNQVKGLNETNLKIAFNDVDFCLRVHQAGFRNIWTPYAELYHYESISRGAEDNPEKIARFNSEIEYMLQRWAIHDSNYLPMCPHYSPFLTNMSEDFSLSKSLDDTIESILYNPFRLDISNYYPGEIFIID